MCLVGFFLSVLVALIPALFYGWFVYWLDRHEKEPWWLLALAFLWGAVPAVIMSIVAQTLLDIPTTWVVSEESLTFELVGGSLWAPLTEEVAKGLGVVLILLVARREMDSVLDGIVYGAMVGLGFSLTEDVLYFGGALAQEGWGSWVFIVLLRIIPFGLNHALFTGLTGAGIAAAYISGRSVVRRMAPLGGLLAGMSLHGIHNLGASLAAANCLALCGSLVFDWGGVLMLGVLVMLVWRQEQRWLAEQLPGELEDELVELVVSWKKWRRARMRAVLDGDRERWRALGQVRKMAVELAFKKRQLALKGPDPRLEQEIDRYRQALAEQTSALATG